MHIMMHKQESNVRQSSLHIVSPGWQLPDTLYTPLVHAATGEPEYPLLQAPAHVRPLKVVPQEKLPLVTVTGPLQEAAIQAK
jgi:hypothetical protein